MLLSVLLAIGAIIAFATATSASPSSLSHMSRHGCLKDAEVRLLRTHWLGFFVNFDPVVANTTLVEDFTLWSESNKLLFPGFPGAGNFSVPQYDSKAAFITGQSLPGSDAHNPNKTISDMFPIVAADHGCSSFTFRWVGYFFEGAPAVAGIDFVFVQPGTYLLEKAYSEYDTGGFLKGLGCISVGGRCGTQNCASACDAPAPETSSRSLAGLLAGV